MNPAAPVTSTRDPVRSSASIIVHSPVDRCPQTPSGACRRRWSLPCASPGPPRRHCSSPPPAPSRRSAPRVGTRGDAPCCRAGVPQVSCAGGDLWRADVRTHRHLCSRRVARRASPRRPRALRAPACARQHLPSLSLTVAGTGTRVRRDQPCPRSLSGRRRCLPGSRTGPLDIVVTRVGARPRRLLRPSSARHEASLS